VVSDEQSTSSSHLVTTETTVTSPTKTTISSGRVITIVVGKLECTVSVVDDFQKMTAVNVTVAR